MKLFIQFTSILVFSVLLFRETAFAHGDLHERIVAISARIDADPANPELLFNRGSLYEQHGDYIAAIADFTAVQKLAPKTEGLQFAKARSYFGLKKFNEALAELDRIEPPELEDGRVMLCRGRVLSELKRNEEAATSYRAAFARIEKVSPDLYLEFAGLIAAGGKEQIPLAIAGLDQAIAKIGPVITLNLAALELEETLEAYDAALSRLNRMLEQAPNMAALLKRKGDVLRELDREDEALDTYKTALNLLELLPSNRRSTEASQELERQIRARLHE